MRYLLKGVLELYGDDHKVRYGSKILIHNQVLIKDEKINKMLRSRGYIVLRFWGSDIKKNVKKCVDKIENIINETKSK